MSVCLSVCPIEYLKIHACSNFTKFSKLNDSQFSSVHFCRGDVNGPSADLKYAVANLLQTVVMCE